MNLRIAFRPLHCGWLHLGSRVSLTVQIDSSTTTASREAVANKSRQCPAA
jgi:hypothetical protein